ncbi:peptidoglycan-binding domain-containing protein [Actinacidiphila guanduensis]|uniref:Putative peptidoglycan binding domain-containing protein n=1 Tax=Actinacidiphila guanduensis TaxID=310781 RepID=A0A1H0D2L9_9ACTN|nr:peptidoglycan-binding domain-containing protein [Actinacidiphila guanduensis]SDN64397.1 Putative peptidoglycan binding domain-containing protein [Actinacidiphila guanduensis]
MAPKQPRRTDRGGPAQPSQPPGYGEPAPADPTSYGRGDLDATAAIPQQRPQERPGPAAEPTSASRLRPAAAGYARPAPPAEPDTAVLPAVTGPYPPSGRYGDAAVPHRPQAPSPYARPEPHTAAGDTAALPRVTGPAAEPYPGPADPDDPDMALRDAERSAERAAALAATEGFHPLRLRPYVGEPGQEPAESTVRPVVTDDTEGGDGPAEEDLGLFPTAFAGVEYGADHDGAEARRAEAAAAARGRHRRRRRRLVVAASAIAASALAAGAVAVTGQVMGDEQSTPDRALPDQNSSMPDVTLPSSAAKASASAAPALTRSAAPTTAASPSTSPSGPPPSATATAHGSAGTTHGASPTATATPTGTASGSAPASPTAPPVLREGDSGPAVADLQRRLQQLGLYYGPQDGQFSHRVQKSLAFFQMENHVSDAPDGSYDGVYGPKTRAALEKATN